jgi:alpha-tubulin suppressor-like RCC1 family protein
MGDDLAAVDLGTGKVAIEISGGGSAHTCALLNDSSVKCWGLNNAGQLGLGATYWRGDQPGEMGDNLPTVQLWGP